MSAQRPEIRPLTSIRGLAALAVVAQHFSATAERHAAAPIPSLVPHGYVAVDLFFALSGFIMAYTYGADFLARGHAAYRPFLIARVARIVPLDLFALAIILAAGAASLMLIGRNIMFRADWLPADLLANILMLQGFGIGTNLNGPSWSISVEFAAYLLFPLFVWLMLAGGPRRAGVTAALALVALVALAATRRRFGLDVEGGGAAAVRCLTEFTLGMAASRWQDDPAAMPWVAGDRVLLAIALAIATALVAGIDLLAALLFPTLIAGLARNRGLACRLLSLPVLHFLGLISFALYLLHEPFRPVELALLERLHPAPLGMAAALVAALLGTLSVIPPAALAYRFIEQPARRLIRRWSARRTARST